jgi:hypothetical protein
MMTRSQNTIRVRIAIITVAALMLVFAAAPHAQAAGLPDCNYSGKTPCFEKVWVDGVQVKMIFANLNPSPTNAPTTNFYVVAPQTGTPQGAGPFSPFLHDHVVDSSPHNAHWHGFLVLCSAQGISSGGCVPTLTSTPQGIIPFAKTVNGEMLTSVAPIESPANSGLLMLIDTGAVFVATIHPGK